MKKPFKRVLSIILCAVMLVGIVPISTFAQSAQNDFSSEETVAFAGETGLNLIAANLTDGEKNDSYVISYLEMEGKTACVDLNNAEPCNLIVAIYNESTMKMYAYGVAEVEEEHDKVKVEIDTKTMPEYYFVKAFLVDEDYAPLCEAYECQMYTSSYEDFLEKSPEDFDESNVVIFDDEKENVDFAVLKEDTISSETSSSMTFSYDEASGTYTFKNAISSIKKLKSGDVYYYEYGTGTNEFLLFKVKSISISGSTVKIVEDKDLTLEDVFDYVRIDALGDFSDVELNENELGEALTVVDESGSDVPNNEGISYGDSTKWSSSFKVDWKLYSNDTDKDDKKDDSTVSASISGTLKYELSTSVKLIYDVVLFGKDYYEFKSETTHKIGLDSFKIEGKLNLPQDVVKIPIPEIPVGPFTLKITVAPLFEISAKVSFNALYTTNTVITADSSNDLQKTQTTTCDWDVGLDHGITIKIGLTIKLELKFVSVVSLGLKGEGGLKYSGKLATVGVWTDVHHDCSACINGAVNGFFDINLTLSIGIPKVDKLKLSWSFVGWSKEWYLFDFYISLSGNGFSCGKGSCKNISYRVTFTVFDKDGKTPLKGAWVISSDGFCDADSDGKYNDKKIKTNSNGKAEIYFKPGEHTVTVEYDGKSKQESFKIIQNEKAISVTLDGNSSSTVLPGEGGLTGSEKTGDIIEFGSYPQSRVTDYSLTYALSNQTKTWKSYGYYSGTGSYGTMVQGDWMKYADVTYNGSKYRAVTFSQLRPYYTYSTNPTSGSNQTTNGYTTKAVYWFKFEPIKWRVLDPASGLVMCESIIDSQPYSNTIYYSGSAYYNDSSYTNYANDYATSSIRDWLNDDFYNTAFSSSQKSQIAVSECDNSCYSLSYPQYNSDMTYDKVFLLSYNEVKYSGYGFSSSASDYDTARRAQGTDYAKCQGLGVSTSSSYSGNSWWWLRSPSSDSYIACEVGFDGYANDYYCNVKYTSQGVRPALRLNLKSSISKSSNKAAKLAASKSPATLTLATSIAAFFENGTFTLSNTVDGNRYMVYGIKNYSDSAKITSTNLVYINQSQASNGKAVFEYKPSSSNTATVVVVGDFGDGTEEKVVKLKDKSELTAELEIKTPSKTTINYGDGIVLHLDVENLPSGATIVWEASNENFTYTVSSDGKTCTVTSKSSGKTTFTATVFDEDGLELSSDTQEMTSKAGFFQKFAAFFKKLFGLLTTYPQSL